MFHLSSRSSFLATASRHSLCTVINGQSASNRSVAVPGTTQASPSSHLVPNAVDNDPPFCHLFLSGNPNSAAVFQLVYAIDASVCLCTLTVGGLLAEVEAGTVVLVIDPAIIVVSKDQVVSVKEATRNHSLWFIVCIISIWKCSMVDEEILIKLHTQTFTLYMITSLHSAKQMAQQRIRPSLVCHHYQAASSEAEWSKWIGPNYAFVEL
jgi:hypothetical protein